MSKSVVKFVEDVLDISLKDYQKSMLRNIKYNKQRKGIMRTSKFSGITYTRQLFDQWMFHKEE